MAIDVSRVKRTRGGHEVRIYATDGCSVYQLHGAIRRKDGWESKTWTSDGAFLGRLQLHDWDLIEEPRTIEIDVWMNVYRHESASLWITREGADQAALPNRIACVNIKRTVAEGEGL